VLRKRQVASKLRDGRWYQSVNAAAPAGGSGNKGPHGRLIRPFADLDADFCNEIGPLLPYRAAQRMVASLDASAAAWQLEH
jgi:hypothetical protein